MWSWPIVTFFQCKIASLLYFRISTVDHHSNHWMPYSVMQLIQSNSIGNLLSDTSPIPRGTRCRICSQECFRHLGRRNWPLKHVCKLWDALCSDHCSTVGMPYSWHISILYNLRILDCNHRWKFGRIQRFHRLRKWILKENIQQTIKRFILYWVLRIWCSFKKKKKTFTYFVIIRVGLFVEDTGFNCCKFIF